MDQQKSMTSILATRGWTIQAVWGGKRYRQRKGWWILSVAEARKPWAFSKPLAFGRTKREALSNALRLAADRTPR